MVGLDNVFVLPRGAPQDPNPRARLTICGVFHYRPAGQSESPDLPQSPIRRADFQPTAAPVKCRFRRGWERVLTGVRPVARAMAAGGVTGGEGQP